MRLFRSLIIIFGITLVALIYVHQQVELVKMSYLIDYKERKLKLLLDLKGSLGYNIANLEDPSRLEKILLAKKIDLSFPKRGNVFMSTQTAPSAKRQRPLGATNLGARGGTVGILEFLGIGAEAQAKEK